VMLGCSETTACQSRTSPAGIPDLHVLPFKLCIMQSFIRKCRLQLIRVQSKLHFSTLANPVAYSVGDHESPQSYP
jgi:hypothetical protein